MTDGWLIRPSGLVPYSAVYEWMHELAERRAAGEIPDTLILLEHRPVYTAGRRTDPLHIRWTESQIEAAGAELHLVDRGGSVTFHGPGQLVGYPILDLGRKPDVLGYLRNIEEAVIRASREVGVELHRDPEATGVWSRERKVCAIGVRVIHARVTLHGFALNCSTDRRWYDAIVPCGLTDRGVATLTELAGREIAVEEMTPLMTRGIEDVFGLRLEPAPAEELRRPALLSTP
jgi:lipoyl(octanoyl) transferase